MTDLLAARTLWLLFGLVSAAPLIATADDDPPAFQWLRTVTLPELTETAPVAITLDEHFHSSTRVGWPDVRVRDEHEQNVGFVIEAAKQTEPKAATTQWPAASLKAQVHSENGLRVEITLGKDDPLPDAIRIITPLRDFEHQVQVESSADGQNWTTAGESTLIFDYSRFIDARNVVVSVAGGDHRHFRLTIADVTAEQESQLLELNRRLRGGQETDRTERTTVARRPFRVDRIEFQRTVVEQQPQGTRDRIYPATDFRVTQNSKEQRTELTFSVRRQPISMLRLLTDTENFHRQSRVEAEHQVENGKLEWINVAEQVVSRFQIGKLQRERLEMKLWNDYSNATGRYRVLIMNEDSPPVEFRGVEPVGPIYELRCLATPGQKLQVEYGSPDAPAGKWDVAALRSAIDSGVVVVNGTLGDPRANPNAPKPMVATWKPWNDTRVLLAGIVALTLFLAWGLYAASSRITLPPEGP